MVGEGPRVDVVRVLIADDQALFRRGLNVVLSAEEGIEVVAEAADGLEAVAQAEEHVPDVVLMDVRMPRMGGIEATRQVKAVVPTAKILVLSASDAEDDLFEAIKAGADGYLLKEVSIEEVAGAVRSAVVGKSLLSPGMASKLISEFASMARRNDRPSGGGTSPSLTRREKEVLRLVAKGFSNRDVARELFISENTVKNHVRNILEKLHLHSRMQAVMMALRENLIDPGQG